MAIIRTKPGVVTAQDGTYPELRGGRKGGLVSQDVGGRYEEAAYRNAVYSISTGGAGQAQAAANLFSTAIATFQPIVGVYNPSNSPVRLSVLKAWVGISAYPASATITGAFMWVVSSGQNSITQAGTVPVSNSTFKQQGSQAVGLVNQALTGATGSLLVLRPMAATLPNAAQISTLAGDTPGFSIYEEQTEGSIIVPPAGVLGIANGITGTTSTFVAGMMWEEIPL
jgi:hypothetical protein